MGITTRFVICALLLAAPAAEAKTVKSADFTAADAEQKALVLWSTSADRTSLSIGTGLLLKHAVMKGDKKKWKQVGAFDVRDAYQRDYEYFNASAHGHKPDSFTVATPVRELIEDETCGSF